jgi:hypothetical protein
MKRPDTAGQGKVAEGVTILDDGFAKRYPSLTEYMTADKYEDGGARERSNLSISIREGSVLLALNDKELKQSIYTSDDTLQGALKLLEGALTGGQAQWRPWKTGKRK